MTSATYNTTRDRNLLARGYSLAAVAMLYGPVGTDEYYDAKEHYGGHNATSGTCSHCGELCFGTGDCNCQEE